MTGAISAAAPLLPPPLATTAPAGDGHEETNDLATRLVGDLAARPFRPTAAQLEAIGAGALIPGDENGPYARYVADRYASLLTDHVFEGRSIRGAEAAYLRVWQCARDAFVRSLVADAERVSAAR
jgi:hypothetical protein